MVETIDTPASRTSLGLSRHMDKEAACYERQATATKAYGSIIVFLFFFLSFFLGEGGFESVGLIFVGTQGRSCGAMTCMMHAAAWLCGA